MCYETHWRDSVLYRHTNVRDQYATYSLELCHHTKMSTSRVMPFCLTLSRIKVNFKSCPDLLSLPSLSRSQGLYSVPASGRTSTSNLHAVTSAQERSCLITKCWDSPESLTGKVPAHIVNRMSLSFASSKWEAIWHISSVQHRWILPDDTTVCRNNKPMCY